MGAIEEREVDPSFLEKDGQCQAAESCTGNKHFGSALVTVLTFHCIHVSWRCDDEEEVMRNED